jgi:hypothetical protein
LKWQPNEKGNKNRRHISKNSDEFKKLGFNREMTRDEARGRAEQLRAELWVELQAKREARSKAVLEKYSKFRSAYLTDEDALEFEQKFLSEFKIQRPHWNTMQVIIVEVGIHPSEWFTEKSKLYDQLRKLRCSPNYAKKLLRYLNLWGYFLCKKQQRAWMKVSGMDGTWRNRLEANRKEGGQSKPLSPSYLENKRGDMKEEHYKVIRPPQNSQPTRRNLLSRNRLNSKFEYGFPSPRSSTNFYLV